MANPLMKCGCVAQGVMTGTGGVVFDTPIPSCIIHDCTEIANDQPDLAGRIAQCSYGPSHHADKPSSRELAFFEYRGAGSSHATEICKCGYSSVAHKGGANHRPSFVCKSGGFSPVGDTADRYYCGCHGWD